MTLPSSTWPPVSTTSNQPTWRSVLEARTMALWIASSRLFSEEPATWIIRYAPRATGSNGTCGKVDWQWLNQAELRRCWGTTFAEFIRMAKNGRSSKKARIALAPTLMIANRRLPRRCTLRSAGESQDRQRRWIDCRRTANRARFERRPPTLKAEVKTRKWGAASGLFS